MIPEHAREHARELGELLTGLSIDRTNHLRNFFNAIKPHVEFRNQIVRERLENGMEGPDRTIMGIPQLDISHEVMGDIFSYSGYEATDELRDQSGKDEIVRAMLDDSLETPRAIVEIGTYDGRRTRTIIDSLRNRGNIIHVYGVDSNPIVSQAFDGWDIPSTPINTNAERLLPILRHLQLPKTNLLLENVANNIARPGGCQHQGLSGILYHLMEGGDQTIIELSNYYDGSQYTDGVEQVFHAYYEQTGLKELLGGKLVAKAERDNKMIFIEGVKERVEFEGEVYEFPSPEFYIPFMGTKTDLFSQPLIFLGVSRSRDDLWSTLFNSLLNYTVVPEEDDWKHLNNQSIMRFVCHPDARPDDEDLAEMGNYFNSLALARGMDQPFGHLSDVLLGLGHYPAHYNSHIQPLDDMFTRQGDGPFDQISDAVKFFMSLRMGKPSQHDNMRRWLKLMEYGHAQPVQFDVQEHVERSFYR